MITVLIVEDNPHKERTIREAIAPLVAESGGRTDSCDSLVSAREHLSSLQYDLVILDLVLPNRMGDKPENDGGISLLNEIAVSKTLIRPGFIVGLTSFSEILEEQKELFGKHLWALIRFDETESGWAIAIRERALYVIESHRYFTETRIPRYDCDIAIIAALHRPELEALLGHGLPWKTRKVPGRFTNFYECEIPAQGSSHLRVVAGAQSQMGIAAACHLTNEVIYAFRPRIVVMVGICGGVASDRQNYADIVFADEVILHDSGKIESGGCLTPDPRTVQVSPELLSFAKDPNIQREVLSRVNASLGLRGDEEIKVHVGPVASGNTVIACGETVKGLLSRARKLQGIEMEGYGVGFACDNVCAPRPDWILVKGICDFSDKRKDDQFQNRAATASMRFALEFLCEIARQPIRYFG